MRYLKSEEEDNRLIVIGGKAQTDVDYKLQIT